MVIQWFPGHMAKAKRQAMEKIKLIDVVFELVDARIPYSSRNPMINEIVQQKPRILLLNKADMADNERTKEWVAYYKSQGVTEALAINSQSAQDVKQIIRVSKELMAEKRARLKAKGVVKMRPIRALILGIPNVGKSTLINRLANKQIAKTGDRPGITTAQQWIKVGDELELLDTPGILWPKFDDQVVGYRLAATGAIKDTILNLQDIAVFTLRYLIKRYPEQLKNRYQLTEIPEDIVELFDEIGRKRGCVMSGGLIDYDKTAELVLRDLRTLKIGNITMEYPEDVETVE